MSKHSKPEDKLGVSKAVQSANQKPKPQTSTDNSAPQTPPVRTNAKNQYR